jgi:hypothetical protein
VITSPITFWLYLLWQIKKHGEIEGIEIRGPGLGLAHHLRSMGWLTGLYRLGAKRVLPTVFAVALIAAPVYGVTRAYFGVIDMEGWVCEPTGSSQLLTTREIIDKEKKVNVDATDVSVDINEVCGSASNGVQLLPKMKYEVEISEPSGWYDHHGKLRMEPGGPSAWFLPQKWLVLPLRRKLTQPWFVPIVRIVGESGDEEYLLKRGMNYITPTKRGELFFYINEAVGWPFFPGYFYEDNEGTARIKIKPIGDVGREKDQSP